MKRTDDERWSIGRYPPELLHTDEFGRAWYSYIRIGNGRKIAPTRENEELAHAAVRAGLTAVEFSMGPLA